MMDRKKLGIIIGIGGPKGSRSSAPDDDTDTAGTDEGDISDEERVAAEDLIDAVKSADATAVVDAYRALRAACEADYGDDGSEPDTDDAGE